jgi:two-component system, chemotaxis family, protein-glutamate methylesterase/glutaminase
MLHHDLVVIGGSAGALQALTNIVELLPPTLPACILIVVHTRAERDGLLPRLLQRRTELPVTFAADGDQLTAGRIYVAPPDRHLLVTSSGLRLVHGPRENGFRPAVDPLFRTAARERGSRVIGVILSGGLSDGTYGLSLIKEHGGVAIVQDPDDATVDGMPRSALASVDVDFVVLAAEIPLIIERVTRQPAGHCGKSKKAGASATSAMSAINTAPTASRPGSATPSTTLCGPPCACSRSMRHSRRGWHAGLRRKDCPTPHRASKKARVMRACRRSRFGRC